MIRMQGAKTSKIMLPCWRRVHLDKSACFKTIFEQIPKIDENDAKHESENDRKIHLKIIRQVMRKNIENDSPKYTNLSDLGSHFGTICVIICGPGAFFSKPVVRNLQGVPPWTDFGLP